MRLASLLIVSASALSAYAQVSGAGTTTSGAPPLSSGIHAGDPGDVFGPSDTVTVTLSNTATQTGPTVTGSDSASVSVTQTPGAKPPSAGTNASVPHVPSGGDGNTIPPPADNTTEPNSETEPPNGAVELLARPAALTVLVAGVAVFVL